MRAPAATLPATRQRRWRPLGHTTVSAKMATIADAGAAGYSETVAHPAVRPTTKPQNRSRTGSWVCCNIAAAAKAKTKHAPASACPQSNVAHAQTGVARPVAIAPNADALTLLPSRNASRKRQAQAAAVGRETPNTVAIYDRATSPRGEPGLTPAVAKTGLIAATAGRTSSARPGALYGYERPLFNPLVPGIS